MDILKNLIYTGLGFASMAADKVQSTVSDLIKKGKLSDVEGKRIVDDFLKMSEAKKNEFEEKFKGAAENVAQRFNYAKKEEVETLELRISRLETRIDELTGKESND